MNILFLGGTRFFGVHAVRALLARGHAVTLLTRGITEDPFGDSVQRIHADRASAPDMLAALDGRHYDIVCDNIAYCSNDVRALLDAVSCDRYVLTSSASVYPTLALRTPESAFDPLAYPLSWCSRADHTYDEIKRQGECALFQAYPAIRGTALRYTYVVGEDDYTRRLRFYVAHVLTGKPMHLENPEGHISFIRSDEAGRFLAWSAEQDFTGPINANSTGTVAHGDIVAYVEEKTGRKAVFSPDGEPCPYNGDDSFSLDVSRADDLGFTFTDVNNWFHPLLDALIKECAAS